jgi:hypothetical protein
LSIRATYRRGQAWKGPEPPISAARCLILRFAWIALDSGFYLAKIVDNRQSIFGMTQQPAVSVLAEPRPLPESIYPWLRDRILVGQLIPGADIRQELVAR